MRRLIDKLAKEHSLTKEEWITLIENRPDEAYLFEQARQAARAYYGNTIFIRGLIEFTNYCKNNCYYCGIRRDNQTAVRYRLSKEQILACCRQGYAAGFRTFVLQGGEDAYFTDGRLAEIVSEIKRLYPDCAVTLSVGERSKESYRRLFDAGADRFLLRHETADHVHYARLHPEEMSFENRIRCLRDLKVTGFQTGCGFMVGSPGQTAEHIAKDMLFITKLRPEMVGIGPFVPHHETPFAKEPGGTAELTLYLLALLRLLKPDLLLPSTTALGTIDPKGREKGILAGANVVMPNLSPAGVRRQYELYDHKLCTGAEAAESLASLSRRIERIGYRIVTGRGDPVKQPGGISCIT